MFKEGKERALPKVFLSLLLVLNACGENVRNKTGMIGKTTLSDIYNKTERIQNGVVEWNSHSDEEKYSRNAKVIHQVSREICKNVREDKFIRADVQVLETGFNVLLTFDGKFCSFRLPLFTDMLTKERASELILSTIQSPRFSCTISTQIP